MNHWYYAENGERKGPIGEAKLVDFLQSEQMDRETKVWRKGMEEWVPANTLAEFKFLEDLPPPFSEQPPPFSGGSPAGVRKGNLLDSILILWPITLVVYLLISFLSLCVDLIGLEDPEFADQAYLWLFPVVIAWVVLLSVFQYKCWTAVPEQFRETTPGKAVGYLFIPFFNFYWAFVSWPGLVRGLRRWKKIDASAGKELENFAIAYAALFVCGFIFLSFPMLSILIGIGDAVLFVMLYRGIINIFKSN